jgi:DNA-binding response OmpR family regulator
LGRTRLLIVEDEFPIRELLVEYLSESGFEVAEAEDGDSAVAWLEKDNSLDLLITDIDMPGRCDGNIVARKAKALHPGPPVIYASGRIERLTNPIDEHDVVVEKPFGPAVIEATVLRLLGNLVDTQQTPS